MRTTNKCTRFNTGEFWVPYSAVGEERQSQICMKKHVYSILAKVYKRKKERK